MKQIRTVDRFRNILGFLTCCLGLIASEAGATYFSISTTSLIGQTGQVAFDYIDGGSPNNSFTIINFDFGAGSSIVSSILTGSVSGNLASSVAFTDTDFFNELLVNLTFGNKISFEVVTATNLAPSASSFPDAFSLFLLDSAGQPLESTSDPTGSNALFRWDFGSDPDMNIFSQSVTVQTNNVPEPSIISLILLGGIILSSLRSSLPIRRKK